MGRYRYSFLLTLGFVASLGGLLFGCAALTLATTLLWLGLPISSSTTTFTLSLTKTSRWALLISVSNKHPPGWSSSGCSLRWLLLRQVRPQATYHSLRYIFLDRGCSPCLCQLSGRLSGGPHYSGSGGWNDCQCRDCFSLWNISDTYQRDDSNYVLAFYHNWRLLLLRHLLLAWAVLEINVRVCHNSCSHPAHRNAVPAGVSSLVAQVQQTGKSDALFR